MPPPPCFWGQMRAGAWGGARGQRCGGFCSLLASALPLGSQATRRERNGSPARGKFPSSTGAPGLSVAPQPVWRLLQGRSDPSRGPCPALHLPGALPQEEAALAATLRKRLDTGPPGSHPSCPFVAGAILPGLGLKVPAPGSCRSLGPEALPLESEAQRKLGKAWATSTWAVGGGGGDDPLS